MKFPKSYRSFLLDFGYASIGGDEIYGLGEGIFPFKGLNIVNSTLDLWNNYKPDYYVPNNLVPFYDFGNGDLYCFDSRRFKGEECPVVLWAHEDFYEYLENPSILETTHENFVEWLNEIVDNYLKYKDEDKNK